MDLPDLLQGFTAGPVDCALRGMPSNLAVSVLSQITRMSSDSALKGWKREAN